MLMSTFPEGQRLRPWWYGELGTSFRCPRTTMSYTVHLLRDSSSGEPSICCTIRSRTTSRMSSLWRLWLDTRSRICGAYNKLALVEWAGTNTHLDRFGDITTMEWWDNLYLNEGKVKTMHALTATLIHSEQGLLHW